MTLREHHVVRQLAPSPPLNIQVEAQADMHRDAKVNGLVGLDN
jgi:hypothetical protein